MDIKVLNSKLGITITLREDGCRCNRNT